jgi:lipid-A-disaccharide synthase
MSPQVFEGAFSDYQGRAILLFDSQVCHVMGFVEPLKRIWPLLKRRYKIYEWIARNRPDYVIGFDSPDFMLPIEYQARRKGAYVAHVVSPSVWAWRKGRTRTVEQSAHELHVLFDFEKKFYEKTSLHIEHIGHPLLNKMQPQKRQTPVKRLLLLPGSRQKEVDSLLPLFLCWARTLKLTGRVQEISLVLAKSVTLPPYTLFHDLIIESDFEAAVAQANLAFVCSGTASLQVAAHACPLVVFYDIAEWKKYLLSWFVTTPWVALPNIIHQKQIVQEFIGDLSARYDEIEQYLQHMIDSQELSRLADHLYDKMTVIVEQQNTICLSSLLKNFLQRGLTKPAAAL